MVSSAVVRRSASGHCTWRACSAPAPWRDTWPVPYRTSSGASCSATRDAGWLARRVDEMRSMKAPVVGRVTLGPELPGSNGLAVLGDVATLRPLIHEGRIQRAIVVPRGAVSDDFLVHDPTPRVAGIQGERAAAAVRGCRLLGRARRGGLDHPAWDGLLRAQPLSRAVSGRLTSLEPVSASSCSRRF